MDDFKKGPYTTGYPEVEEAIHVWNESRDESQLDKVLKLLFSEMKKGMEGIMPVTLEGNVEHPEADQRVTYEPQLLELATGSSAMAAFTSGAEFTKGEPSATVTLPMKEIMQRCLDRDDCFGLVLNPWGEGMLLPKPLLCNLVSAMKPVSEAEFDFREGFDAFEAGDYDRAIAYYTAAANAGHLEAMRNLGFCYAFIQEPADNARAKQCWETAAQKGDVASICLLGDLYRTGAAGEANLKQAQALYRNAWLQSRNDNHHRVYPDACLRVLKYARDGFETEQLYNMARDCVAGLRARIEDGDKVSDKMLEEAQALLDEMTWVVGKQRKEEE